MPIYEYQCQQCRGRFQKLVSGFREPSGLQCPRCASTNVRKAVSRFGLAQSEDARMEALADPSMMSGFDENDPAAVARWAKKMGQQLGDDVGDDWNEVVDEMLEEEYGSGGAAAAGDSDDLGWD